MAKSQLFASATACKPSNQSGFVLGWRCRSTLIDVITFSLYFGRDPNSHPLFMDDIQKEKEKENPLAEAMEQLKAADPPEVFP